MSNKSEFEKKLEEMAPFLSEKKPTNNKQNNTKMEKTPENVYNDIMEGAELDSLFGNRSSEVIGNERENTKRKIEEIQERNDKLNKELDATLRKGANGDPALMLPQKSVTKSLNKDRYSREKTREAAKGKQTTRSKLIKIGTGSIAALLLLAGVRHGVEIKERIEFHRDLQKSQDILTNNLSQDLSEAGIDVEANKDILDKIDYSKFIGTDISEVELYGYYLLLGPEATENIITSMNAIDDGSGYYVNYTDEDNYYARLGYTDQKSGKPSEEVWKNYMESKLVEQYRSGALTEEGGKSR